jgi:NADPH:quinone reductase-like Zn-dependent oxidoreductase
MVQVRQSTIVDAPVTDVWRILRDFNGHDRWHPAIVASAIEGSDPADAVGSVRRLRLSDGSELREQLLSLSDKSLSLIYCLLDAPLPLNGYVASIRLKPVTDGDRTFWEWRSEFQPPEHRRDELVRLVEDIYQNGFAAIRQLLRRVPSPPPVETRPAASPASVASPGTVTDRSSQRSAARSRAIIVSSYGGPEALELKEIVLPQLAWGEVRIRHTAIGVNFIDVYCRNGNFDLLKPPGAPGMEAAGVIEALGSGVTDFKVGDRVAYACLPVGAYSERRNMSPELMVRLPGDISDETAAATLLKGVTASFLLHDVHAVKPGEIVLIHAAAGGVGQLLTQWARQLGATVIGVVSNDDKAHIVDRLGAHRVIVRSGENFAEAAIRMTNGVGVDVIYDPVGRDTFDDSVAALAVRGHLVSFGQASGAIGEREVTSLTSKSATLSLPNYEHYTDSPDKLEPHIVRFFSALRQGLIEVQPPKRYDLGNAADAHRDLESRRTTGSLILTV